MILSLDYQISLIKYFKKNFILIFQKKHLQKILKIFSKESALDKEKLEKKTYQKPSFGDFMFKIAFKIENIGIIWPHDSSWNRRSFCSHI